MKLSTIWTLRAMPISERFRRTRDWAAMSVVAFVPLRVRFFVTLREIGKATMDSPNVPATPLEEILEKLDAPKNLT